MDYNLIRHLKAFILLSFFCGGFVFSVEGQSLPQEEASQFVNLLRRSSNFAKKMNPLAPRECSAADLPVSAREKVFVTGIKKSEIAISVVSEEEVFKLFDEMANQKHIPFKYPEDGCHARAHEMCRLLERKGIIAGKLFVEGKLKADTPFSPKGFVNWRLHVAPILLVKKNGELHPYVIDPSLYNGPVPIDEWTQFMIAHPGGKITREYYTNRFQYLPESPTNLKHYREKDLQESNLTMKYYSQVVEAREKASTKGYK